MNRTSRILATIYTGVTIWLAYCTINTWGDIPLWTSITMLAVSIVPLVATLREAEHVDELRILRRQLERATRPPLNRPAITEQERAVFERLIAGIDLDDAA